MSIRRPTAASMDHARIPASAGATEIVELQQPLVPRLWNGGLPIGSARIVPASRRRKPACRPPQIRSRLRFAATAQPAQPGRHRARRAASGRCRRDAEAGRTAARLRQPAGPRQGRRRAEIGATRRRIARRLHSGRRHRGRGRPPHPAQGRIWSTRPRNACGCCRGATTASTPRSAW